MTEPATEPTTEPTTGEPPKADDKGKGGKDAVLADLAKERDARQALEKKLADQQGKLDALAPLAELAKALGVKPGNDKTDVQALTEQVAEMQRQQKAAELRAVRLEVAAEKGLTPQQAARLQGATREELAADADALKSLFPTPTPGTPAPDPSQGARGGAADLEAQLKAAQDAKNTREVIRLKTALAEQKRK